MISINYRDSRPIYEQVREGYKQLIISGVLAVDYKMPSVRELAAKLAINPNTIQRAYRELEQEGFICSVPGKGSFVCHNDAGLRAHREELIEKFRQLVKELTDTGMKIQELIELLKEGENDTGI